MKIKVKRNTNGDTRVATKIPTLAEFEDANSQHVYDVSRVMEVVAHEIVERGKRHDWSKIKEPYKNMFYQDLCDTISGNMDFMDGEWAKFHYSNERHHLLRNVPEDVNLIDVMEMIIDCVCAGMARSGEVRPLEIDESILTTAMENTVLLVKNMIEVK